MIGVAFEVFWLCYRHVAGKNGVFEDSSGVLEVK